MKLIKKALALLLAMTMLVLAVPFTVMAADEPTIAVSTSKAYPGKEVDVTIDISNNPGIVALLINVEYDNENLTLTGITNGTTLEGPQHNSNQLSKNPFIINFANDLAVENNTKNGTIVTLKFAVANNAKIATAPVNVTYKANDIYDVNMDNVAFEIKNGGVEVQGLDLPEIRFYDDEVEYDGEEHKIEIKVMETELPEGANITYTLPDGSNFKGATKAGEYVVTATVTAPGYNKWSKTKTLIITKKDLIIDVEVPAKEYDGTDTIENFKDCITVDGLIEGDNVTIDYDNVRGKYMLPNAGTWEIADGNIAVRGGDLSNYNIVNAWKDAKITINPKPITVKADDVTVRVGADMPEFTYTAVGLVEGDTLRDVSFNTYANTYYPGEYPITISVGKYTNINYTISTEEGTFKVIEKDEQEVTVAPVTNKKYGEENFVLSVTLGENVASTSVKYEAKTTNVSVDESGNVTILGVGRAEIVVSKQGDEKYGDFSKPITFDIEKMDLTVTADDKQVMVGEALPEFTYTITPELREGLAPVNTSGISVYCYGNTYSEGSYPIFVNLPYYDYNNPNYSFTPVNGTLTVSPKNMPVHVAPTGLVATYSQKLSDIALVNPEGNTEGTWSWMNPNESVGDASAEPKNFKAIFVPADTKNYQTVENIDVPVIVKAKNITVSVSDISDQEYTGAKLEPSVIVSGDDANLVLGTDYVVEYGENVVVGANSGSVVVKAKENGNYVFETVVKNFNIVHKAGTVTISGNLNVTYGIVVPDVTVDKHESDGEVTVYYYTNAACTDGETSTKPTDAGNYWARAKMTAGTNFGGAVSNVVSFVIARADIAPSVILEGWTYKEAAKTPSVEGNLENGAVTYAYKVKGSGDNTYSAKVPTNAGNYTVKAEITETKNYNAGSATADFAISAKALADTMVADTAAQNYADAEIKPSPAVVDTEALTEGVDFTYAYENNMYVGSATVKVEGKGNYSGTITKNFDIVSVEQNVAITPVANVTKGGNTVDLKALVSGAKGDVTFAISGEANGCTIDNGVLTSGENSGIVKISVDVSAKDVNGDATYEYKAYSLADAITVSINDKETQAPINITSSNTVTYGQTLVITSEGGSGEGAVTYAVTNGTGEATIDGNVLTPIKVGTVTVVATKAEDAVYNSVSSTPFEITIEKIKVVIPEADTSEYIYNAKEQTYVLTENEAYTISGNKQTTANEDGYDVTVSLNTPETHAWSDDSIEAKNYKFVIKKATITVKANDQSIYVNGTVPVLGAEHYTVSGLAEGETLKTLPMIEYEAEPDATKTGSVVIKVYGAEVPDSGNYNEEVVYTNGTLTIKNVYYGGGGGTPTRTVYLDMGDGTKTKLFIDKGTKVAKPATPEREGFVFGGWFVDSDCTEEYDFDTKVDQSFTIYAKWTPVEDVDDGKNDEKTDEEKPVVWENKYSDVAENDWYYEAVKKAVENGIMNGVSETEFAPDMNLTRGMLVTMLYRAEKEPDVINNAEDVKFDDIDADKYYAAAVVWAYENAIVNGMNDTEFAPDANITREQIATILFRYAAFKGVEAIELSENLFFDDADEISGYAVAPMNWLVGKGVITGYEDGTVRPRNNATRAEVATMAARIFDVLSK